MKVCVIGVGGLGANVALALAECGYELTLVDFDVVDEKFLRRFIPTRFSPIKMFLMGRKKVDVVREFLGREFEIDARVFNKKFEEVHEEVDADFYVIAVDYARVRRAIESILRKKGAKFIHVGVNEGSVSVFETIFDDTIIDGEIPDRDTSYDREPRIADYMAAVGAILEKIGEVRRWEG